MVEKYPSKYIGFQTYFQDEWANTNHKTLKSLEKEAKQYGDGEIKKMYVCTSWFESDTYYYIDNMGHTILFRGITDFNRDYWDKRDKKIRQKVGNGNFCIETMEEKEDES